MGLLDARRGEDDHSLFDARRGRTPPSARRRASLVTATRSPNATSVDRAAGAHLLVGQHLLLLEQLEHRGQRVAVVFFALLDDRVVPGSKRQVSARAPRNDRFRQAFLDVRRGTAPLSWRPTLSTIGADAAEMIRATRPR